MRISDWSSDVCSSDLQRECRARGRARRRRRGRFPCRSPEGRPPGMTRKGRLLRIFWPAALFAAGVVAYASHEEAVAALGLDLDLSVVRLSTGGFCYFAAAWLGSRLGGAALRSEEHTSELQSLMRYSYAVLFLK